MFEPYYLYFNIKKMQRYKEGLEAYKNNDNYLYYEKDKQRVNDYIYKFMTGLVRAADKMFIESYIGDLAKRIEELAVEINKNKDEINAQDQENLSQNYNEAQNFMYGTAFAKNDVNKMIAERNELIKNYKNPRPALKALIVEKLSSGLYENVNLDELSDAIIDGNLEYFESHKDIAEKIDVTDFASIYNDIFSSNLVETTLNEIPDPKISYEIYKYGISEEIENPSIDGLVSSKQLEQMEYDYKNLRSLEEGAEYQEEADDKKFLGQRIEKCNATMEAFENNGKALRTILGGLDSDIDHAEMENRVEKFIASIACGDIEEMVYKPIGIDEDSYNDFEEVGKYVRQLIEKSDAFGSRSNYYLSSLDFEKIVNSSKEKYEGKINNEQPNILAHNIFADGNREIEDGKKIYELINNSDDPKAAFNNLINDCLNGESNLTPYKVKELPHTPENIGKVVNYITKLYNAHKVDLASDYLVDEENNPIVPSSLDDHGISNEYIKKKCDSLVDPELGAQDMLNKFYNQLNLYSVEGEEHEALNDPSRDSNDKYLLKALAKTEGLNVEKDSEKLNDAIATYGRMKEIHANRGTFYWLFHPVLNYRENQVIKEMKNTLVNKYGFTDRELKERVAEVTNKSSDEINKAYQRLNNPEEYKNIVKNEKENQDERNKIIVDQLENIDKYGQREKPAELGPNQEIVKTRILKNGAVIDNVDLSEKPYDMSFEDFLIQLANQDATLEAVLKDKPLTDEEKLKRREDAKIESIQKFIDFNGYKNDKEIETAETIEEIKNLKADLDTNDPEVKETIKFNNEVNRINKEVRNIRTQIRLEKFNKMLDELNEKEELEDIKNAESEEEKAEAQAIYDKNHKEREERAQNRKVNDKKRTEKLVKLYDDIQALNANVEAKALKQEYNATFNSIDDSKRSNEKTASEESTIKSLTEKFNLSLDEEFEEKNSKDDFAVEEVQEDVPETEPELN